MAATAACLGIAVVLFAYSRRFFCLRMQHRIIHGIPNTRKLIAVSTLTSNAASESRLILHE